MIRESDIEEQHVIKSKNVVIIVIMLPEIFLLYHFYLIFNNLFFVSIKSKLAHKKQLCLQMCACIADISCIKNHR